MPPFDIGLLNSPGYYTVYPPFGQFVFYLSNILSGGDWYWSAIYMKLFMFLAEAGSVFILIDLVKKYGLLERKVLVYILNPIVVIEFVGNLHSEGYMVFFLLLSIWCLEKNILIPSSIAFALSIAAKLLPVLFLPLLVWKYGLVTGN